MPDKADLQIYQADDWSAVVTVQYADGTPANITGFTAQAQIRCDVYENSPETVLAEMQTSVASPEVNLFLSHNATAAIDAGKYLWDLQITSPTGQVTTVLYGKATIQPDVTRELIA